MIRVTVAYPNVPGKRFDHCYYADTHVALVRRTIGRSLVRVEIEKGLVGATPGSPAPFVAIGHVYFRTMEDAHDALGTHAPTLMADIPNYTDIEPQFQIGEVMVS